MEPVPEQSRWTSVASLVLVHQTAVMPSPLRTWPAQRSWLSVALVVLLSIAAGARAQAGEANRAPQVIEEPDAVTLEVGDSAELELDDIFRDPDGDRLRYSTSSTDEDVATARASRDTLRISAWTPGVADIVVEARDPQRLTAEVEIEVDVVAQPCPTVPAQAPEGGKAVVMAELVAAVEPRTTVLWRAVPDRDPQTADADAGEHGGASGETSFAPWERCVRIEVAVAQDAEVEPAREWFAVDLRLRRGGVARLTRRLVPVAVLEGVCDRTPAVRDALLARTRDTSCEMPTGADLGRVRTLYLNGRMLGSLAALDLAELSGLRALDLRNNALARLPTGAFADLGGLHTLRLSDNALAELRPDAFAGLSRLRELRLERNALRALPDGVFAGLSSLQHLRLDGNPGAPFALAVELERIGAAPWARSPARVRATVPAGAPFNMVVDLSVTGGTFADGSTTARTRIAGGDTASRAFVIRSTARFAQVSLSVPGVSARCYAERCWRGFELAAGEPLGLFARPPRVLAAPTPQTLFGDALVVPLRSLVAPGVAGDRLRWRARSLDPALALARVAGGALVVEPEPGAQGTVLVEATATDRNGQTATVRFEVHVEFRWPVHPRSWRHVLPSD